MTTRCLLITLLICCCGASLLGSPVSDLSSPSQEVRDAAAKILRGSYAAPSRTNWDFVVSAITKGMAKTNVLKLLSPYKVKSEGGFGGGGSYSEMYRLDDAWMLVCGYRQKDDVLIERLLSMSLRYVWVAPTTNFTGTWVIYFVNGQKSREIHYENGKYHGEFIMYSPDGARSVIQHYDHRVAEGTDTGYYASGRIKYRGVYKAGKQSGTWIWYNEDGSTSSTQDYSK